VPDGTVNSIRFVGCVCDTSKRIVRVYAYNGSDPKGRCNLKALHDWAVTPKEAARLQETLAGKLLHAWDGREVRIVAGVDVSVKDGRSRAAVVLLSFPELEPMASVCSEMPTPFPYVPGLLTFREGPAVLEAWDRLPETPDLVLFDGQGIAHPRHIGLAAHLGLWLNLPSIGCAKSRLYGTYEVPGPRKGDVSALHDKRDRSVVIGSVVRTRENVKPLFVSPGHRIDVENAVRFTLACCRRLRLPEPTRWAHRVAGGENLLGSNAQSGCD